MKCNLSKFPYFVRRDDEVEDNDMDEEADGKRAITYEVC